MLTNADRGRPVVHKRTEDAFIAATRTSPDRFSLRLQAAPAGVITLVAMVSGLLLIPIGAHFGKGSVLSRVLSIVVFVFAPAILGALYSLFFEESKLYGCVDLLLAGVVLLKQPFTWFWVEIYVPFACAFTILCVIVRLLKRIRR